MEREPEIPDVHVTLALDGTDSVQEGFRSLASAEERARKKVG